jgi:glutamate dehydrogenase
MGALLESRRNTGDGDSMSPSAIDELVAYARTHGGAHGERMGHFVAAYFDGVDPAEVVARGPAALFAVASTHWRLLAGARPQQAPQVRVFNPTLAEDGFVSDHTVLQIVQQDMPFLVDSVTMAVNRSGRTAHWIVHPLLQVLRGQDGQVIDIARADGQAEPAAPGQVASLIMVECDRIVSASDRSALAADILHVLADVRAAVQDWHAMRERLHAVCAAAASAPVPAGSRAEGIAFLQWLEDRHFTFLGARDYDLQRDADGVSLRARAGSGLGILRTEPDNTEPHLPAEAVALIDSADLLLVTKAMTRSTVHRPAWLDSCGREAP